MNPFTNVSALTSSSTPEERMAALELDLASGALAFPESPSAAECAALKRLIEAMEETHDENCGIIVDEGDIP